MPAVAAPSAESLHVLLKALKLSGFVAHLDEVSAQAQRDGWTFTAFLHELVSLELEDRRRRKIEPHMRHGIVLRHAVTFGVHDT